MSANRLGHEKVSKLIIQFSLPATVGMLINAIYNVVDRLFIGNSQNPGADGLAALTVAFPVMMIMMAFAIMIGIGGSTRFSIHLGRKEPEKAAEFLGNAFFLMIALSVIITLFGLIFIKPLLIFIGASENILPLAIDYLSIILIGTIFQTVSMGLNNFIRADGSPNIAMVTMFIGAGFNIVFDAILILGFNMGMKGAAIATIGGQALSATWCLVYFLKISKVKLKLKYIKPNFPMLLTIFTTGTPAFIMNVVGSVLNMILNKKLIQYGGDFAISAMGIVNSIQTFLIMPIIGINQGVQPIISYNFGAKRIDRSQSALKLGILYASIISVIGWGATRLFSKQLIMVFTPETALHEMGEVFIYKWFFCIFLVGFQIIGANFFQAIGKPLIATILTMSRQVLLLIPSIIIFSELFGLDGILWAAPIADFISAIIVAVYLPLYLKRQSRLYSPNTTKSEQVI